MQRHPRGETESWFGRSAFKVAGRPHDDESAYGVDGARQLAVVDSVAVVEEFEVVTDAMTQVHAMAVPRPGDKRDGLTPDRGPRLSAKKVHVITQGLGTICEARHLVLIATGGHKAEAVAAAVEGPLTASCPASVLQLHPHVTAVIDEAAAGQLKNVEFYRYALKHKPAQQKY